MIFGNKIETQLKKTSVRGRLAFGTKCIEQYLIENNITSKWADRLIDTLWEFTTSNRLDHCDEKIRDLSPGYILDSHPNSAYFNCTSLSKTDYRELRTFYGGLPGNLVKMIDDTIEIGTGNLYGGTGKYSEFTLRPVLLVHKTAKKTLKKTPGLSIFTQAKFSKSHGWGDPVEKKRFKENV